jgi:hypothetical protein
MISFNFDTQNHPELYQLMVRLAKEKGFTLDANATFGNTQWRPIKNSVVRYFGLSWERKSVTWLTDDHSTPYEGTTSDVGKLIEFLAQPQPETMTIGGYDIQLFKDGTVKFGCTKATKEQVDEFIQKRAKVYKPE